MLKVFSTLDDLNSDCSACGLDKLVKSPKIKPYGLNRKKIMFCGEAPGGEEDIKGEPFVGDAGKLLRGTAEALGLDFYQDCVTVNAINCRPFKMEGRRISNRTPEPNEVKWCRPRVLRAIKEYQPELIILLGGIPCLSVLGTKDISNLRGFVIPDRNFNCWIAPVFHPSAINRNANWDKYIGIQWVEDLQRALDTYKNKFPNIEFEFESSKDLNVIYDYIDKCFQEGFAVLDWETVFLKPYKNGARIRCCGLGCNDSPIVFPVNEYWTEVEFKKLRSYLKELVCSKDVIKIAHNLKFERMWCIERLGFDFEEPFDCTMLMDYALDERNNIHGLKDIVWKEFGDRDYDAPVKQYKKDMTMCPEALMHSYCAKDVFYEKNLYFKYLDRLNKEEGSNYIYENHLLPAVSATLDSERRGAILSTEKLDVLYDDFEEKAVKLITEIKMLPKVRSYEKQKSKELSLSSSKDVTDFLFNFCRIKPPKLTKKNNASTDDTVLKEIGGDFCDRLLKVRQYATLRSTFIKGLKENLWDDGKLHTNYLLHGTVTGRPSSSEPNLQNIPRREFPEIRKGFIAPPKHVLISNDYDQWEVRNLQMCCRDPNLGKAIWDNVDFHAKYAIELFGQIMKVDPSDKGEFKKIRDRSKNEFVFPTFYDAKPPGIARAMGLPEEVIAEAQRVLFEDFHYLREWQFRLAAFYKQYGYVENLFGRRRRAPLSHNEMINYPVQSTAVEFVILSWIRCVKDGLWVPLEVHDDLGVYALEENWLETYYKIEKNMTEWEFDFINVPINIDSKVGMDWYEQYPVKEFMK